MTMSREQQGKIDELQKEKVEKAQENERLRFQVVEVEKVCANREETIHQLQLEIQQLRKDYSVVEDFRHQILKAVKAHEGKIGGTFYGEVEREGEEDKDYEREVSEVEDEGENRNELPLASTATATSKARTTSKATAKSIATTATEDSISSPEEVGHTSLGIAKKKKHIGDYNNMNLSTTGPSIMLDQSSMLEENDQENVPALSQQSQASC